MNRRLGVILATLGAAIVAVAVFAMAGGAATTGGKVKFEFLACTGFLTPPDFPSCISHEFNGDSIESTGSGTFEVKPDGTGKVKGGGTFIHRDSAGNVLAHGTWKAKEFLAYRTYGCAGCPSFLPEGSEGGNLLVTAQFDPAGPGPKVDGTVEINCALGTPPPNRGYEAIEPRLLGLRFDQDPEGATLFIRE